LFLIVGIIAGREDQVQAWANRSLWNDAMRSHNVKDPLEDLIQALEAISISYAKALLLIASLNLPLPARRAMWRERRGQYFQAGFFNRREDFGARKAGVQSGGES